VRQSTFPVIVLLAEGTRSAGMHYAGWMCSELAGFLAGRLAKCKISWQLVFVEYSPRTPYGKIAKGELRATELSGEADANAVLIPRPRLNAACAPQFFSLYRGFMPTAREQEALKSM
jgi:hypothetical protein